MGERSGSYRQPQFHELRRGVAQQAHHRRFELEDLLGDQAVSRVSEMDEYVRFIRSSGRCVICRRSLAITCDHHPWGREMRYFGLGARALPLGNETNRP